jgi:pimeloyl-ACP methyl ester carboxylesterase
MLKWTLRIGGGLIAMLLITAAVLFAAYSIWMSGQRRALLAGSEITSTSLGNIEYAILGEGEPTLSIHGAPGGYDQALLFPRLYPEHFAGVRTIAVSRPGYLRTPLISGETPEQQADLYAALLDKLGIDRVVVMGSSGGAPSAVQFAIRHPERIRALVLIVPLLKPMKGTYDPQPPEMFLVEQNVVTWLMGERLGKMMMPQLDGGDERQLRFARDLARTQIPAGLRVDGLVNDTLQFRKLDFGAWPLEQVAAPTLILHGDADKNAPYEGSAEAAARIPGAKLETFERGDHYIVVTRADEILSRIKQFVADMAEKPVPAPAPGPAPAR